MTKETSDSNVIAIAKAYKEQESNDGIIQLTTGYFCRIVSVSGSLIEESQSSVPEPSVPKWYNEQAKREEENPAHPAYIKAMEKWEVDKTLVALDAMLMFGVLLVSEDGEELKIEPGKWLLKLKFLADHGIIDLSDFSFDDELTIEFLFKKFIAVGAPDIPLVAAASTLSEEKVAKATKSFPGN